MDPKVKIIVIEKGADAIIGVVLINGLIQCFTLMPARKYIGPGMYHCQLEWSPRFGCELYEIKDHPTMEEVKFHTGNTSRDTDGCPLLGMSVGTLELNGAPMRAVIESRAAFGGFMSRLAGVQAFTLYVVEFGV